METQANPFDQFGDLGAALPPAGQPQGAPPAAYGAPPPQAAGGVYGAPPPQQGAPPGGVYGAPPPQGGMYGAPPPQAPPPAAPPAGGMYGAPPDMGAAPPPASPPAAAADPFAGFGAPAPPQAPPAMAPPPTMPPAAAPEPPAQDNPFGGGAPPPAAPTMAPPPPVAAEQPPPAYGAPMPPPAGAADPFGGGVPPPAYGAPPPGQPGMPPAQPGMAPPPPAAGPGAIVPAETQTNPYAAAAGVPPPGQPGYPPQQPQPGMYGDPAAAGAMVPAGAGAAAPPPPAGGADMFSVFDAQPAAAGALVPAAGTAVVAAAPAAQEDDDFWGAFSANAPAPAAPEPAAAAAAQSAGAAGAAPTTPGHATTGAHSDELPPGGEWYDARIFTPTLGVMFFKPQELTDSLFLNTDKSIVDGLSERPVVAFIVEGSSARSAGVELGHVLLKVNGVDVKNPKEASRLIKEGPRPLPLLFYVPNTEVVVAEGEHMVKYDTRETTAPNSAKDWKPKYVVIGGIIAQPWMMNMYRSKSEYDIAVIETQARRPVSVKVKQFSLQGARIQNDWQGPQMVKYKNKLHPWKYIVVLPVARNPIKISSPNLASLKPVHEGIRRVLLAQQRDRGSKPRPTSQGNGAPQQQHAPPAAGAQPYGGQQQAYRY